jgi:putative membrane protein
MREFSFYGIRISPPRLASVIFSLCGFAMVVWLLHENDYRAVLHIVAMAGWGLAIVVMIRGIILAFRGLAWWCLLRDFSSVRVYVAIGLRTIGEAVNVLLPVATVGGDIVRTILLKRRGVDGGTAAASTLVDLLLQAVAQALLVLIGIALLLRVAGAAELASLAASGLGVAVLALGGFYALQRFGGARLVERGLGALARRWPAAATGTAIRLHRSLQAIYADRSAVAAGFALHAFAWLIGALETWTALRLVNMPVSASTALILETLNQGLRTAAFPVPGALGVQEGGFIALGALFGIPAETALALSLIKRLPDLAIGLPSLLACYLLQIQRLLRSRSVATAGGRMTSS